MAVQEHPKRCVAEFERFTKARYRLRVPDSAVRKCLNEPKEQLTLTSTAFNLIVLKTPNVDVTVEFYRALGLSFVAEQHGRGPRHWAAQIGGVVLEIYPLNDGQPVDNSTRLGFTVGTLAETLSALKSAGVTIAAEPKSTSWGLRAVVLDPDGRSVELLQRPAEG